MKKQSNIRWLWGYYKPYQIKFFILVAISIGITVLLTRYPSLIGQFTEDVIENGNRSRVVPLLASIGAISIIASVGKYFYLLSFQKIAQDVVYNLRQDLYNKILHLDQEDFHKCRTGTLMSRMTGDTNMLINFLAFGLQEILTNVILVIAIMLMMFTVSPFFFVGFLFPMPFLFLVGYKHSKAIRPGFKKIRDAYASLNTVVQENVVGNRVVKAFMNEQYEYEKFNSCNSTFKNANLDAVKVWRRFVPIIDSTGYMMNAILILIGGVLYYYDRVSMADIVEMSAYLTLLNRPIRSFGWAINKVEQLMASTDKIREVMLIDSKIHPEDASALTILADSQPPLRGDIVFDHVSFNHGSNRVVKDFSLHITPGKTIALVGATGSGKSTIIDLIGRFYDTDHGEIRIDNKPIHQYDVKYLRNQMAMSLQSVFLFSDTIINNIRYGYPQADDEEVLRIADIAGVHEFVTRMPAKYHTVIGENGVGLSGGQKQRIALARALIKNPSILILDDTTSSVDLETEYKIHQSLQSMNSEQTTILIAHRISSIKHADEIIVMDNGSIVERGTHQQLINNKKYYYEVFRNQMGDFDLDVTVSHACS